MTENTSTETEKKIATSLGERFSAKEPGFFLYNAVDLNW
jgi:hypothetical protein